MVQHGRNMRERGKSDTQKYFRHQKSDTQKYSPSPKKWARENIWCHQKSGHVKIFGVTKKRTHEIFYHI